jgi:essential nuclear protein 1
MPKATTPTAGRQGRRHNPLEEDVIATGVLRTKPGKRKSKDRDENDEHYVDSKASKNILRIGRQLDEEDAETRAQPQSATIDSFGYDSRFEDGPEDENQVYGDDDEAWGDEDEVVEEIEVDPEDLETYKKFMPDDEDDLLKHGWDRRPTGEEQESETINLADLILEKIAQHEAGEARKAVGVPDEEYELPPKVVEVYTKYVLLLVKSWRMPFPGANNFFL